MSDREAPEALRARISDYTDELTRLRGDAQPERLRRDYLLRDIADLKQELQATALVEPIKSRRRGEAD